MPNRKARRAAASSSITEDPTSSIPLSQPTRSPPEGATLIELASSRHPSLNSKATIEEARWEDLTAERVPIRKDNLAPSRSVQRLNGENGEEYEPAIGPAGDALIYSISLSMLHFTLGVLVMHQYAMQPEWSKVVWDTSKAFVPMYAIVYLLHPQSESRWAQALFLGLAVGTGGYLIYAVNEFGYYAVMKRAPALGTLWVWSVVELRLELAVLSLVACGAWLWYGGWSLI